MTDPTFLLSGRVLQIVWPCDIRSTNAMACRDFIYSSIKSADSQTSDWSSLHLNLKKTELIDSTGQNMLVHLSKFLKEKERKLALTVSHPPLHRVLMLTHLVPLMEITFEP